MPWLRHECTCIFFFISVHTFSPNTLLWILFWHPILRWLLHQYRCLNNFTSAYPFSSASVYITSLLITYSDFSSDTLFCVGCFIRVYVFASSSLCMCWLLHQCRCLASVMSAHPFSSSSMYITSLLMLYYAISSDTLFCVCFFWHPILRLLLHECMSILFFISIHKFSSEALLWIPFWHPILHWLLHQCVCIRVFISVDAVSPSLVYSRENRDERERVCDREWERDR